MTSFTLNVVAGAQAFGDGSHPSTKGAIAAMEGLAGLPGINRVLDLGCGNGILGLMAARHWGAQVIAADIKQEAVTATLDNAQENGLKHHIHAVRSDGCQHPIIQQSAPYDLILCNILAEKLTEFAADMSKLLEDEGLLILSGILSWHGSAVLDAYMHSGLTLIQRLTVQDWVTFILQK
jgi:ribosomal protein L11 methyltransferase